MHGALAPARLGRLYAGADVFVSASAGETYGMVYGEALAAGLPIVGWRSGSLPELIEDGREGCLVAPGDVEGLARALERLSTDEAWRRRLAAAARQRGAALPTWSESADAFFGALSQLAAAPRLNQRTTGPSGPTSMRDTPASSTYIRQAISTGASRAQASAALIGLTWVTTTIVDRAARSVTSLHAAPTRAASKSSDSPPGGANEGSRRHR